MSTKKKTVGEMLARWEALNTTLKQHLADLPQSTQDQADFEALINNVKSLVNSEDSLLAQLREATRNRLDQQKLGRGLRNRLAAQVQGKFGVESERLLAFGVPPRKTAKRPRKKKSDGGTTPAPASPTTPATPETHNPPAA